VKIDAFILGGNELILSIDNGILCRGWRVLVDHLLLSTGEKVSVQELAC